MEIILQKRASLKESRVDPNFEEVGKRMDPVLENAVLKFSKFVASAYTQVLKYTTMQQKIKKGCSNCGSEQEDKPLIGSEFDI